MNALQSYYRHLYHTREVEVVYESMTYGLQTYAYEKGT